MNRYDDLIASRRIYLYLVFLIASILYGIKVIRFNYGVFQIPFWVTLLDHLDVIFLVLIIFPFFVTTLFRTFITDDFFYKRGLGFLTNETLIIKRIFYSWENFQLPHLKALIDHRQSLTPIKTIDEAIAYIHRNPFFILYVDPEVLNDPDVDLIRHFRFDAHHPWDFELLLLGMSYEVAKNHEKIYIIKDKKIARFHKIISISPFNHHIHNLSKAFHKNHASYSVINAPNT
jgi:hypothetical protein